MHYHLCRWHMICNGRTAIIAYLARPDVLFVSDVIRHDAGEREEALTIAMAMLALLTIPTDRRPTCTFNDEVLKFRPSAVDVAAAKKRADAAFSLPSTPPRPSLRSSSPLSSPPSSGAIGL